MTFVCSDIYFIMHNAIKYMKANDYRLLLKIQYFAPIIFQFFYLYKQSGCNSFMPCNPCLLAIFLMLMSILYLIHSYKIIIFVLVHCISHGHVYHIRMEILGLKEGNTTLLYVLDMVGSTRKCWLVVE